MAPSFGRSISFPLSPARGASSSGSSKHPRAARHVRSISLPSCRAAHHHNPLLARLHATVLAVRAWAASSASDHTTAGPAAGLAHIDALHAALAELLLHPEPRAALRRSSSAAADCLLDGALALADAHGAFQETLLELRRHAADARAALRRRDHTRLASAARAQRRAEKDLARLTSSARVAARVPSQHLLAGAGSAADAEMAGALAEAVAAVAIASAAVFSAVEAVSSAATAAAASSSKKPATGGLMSLVTMRTAKAAAAAAFSDEEKEVAALDRMEALEECLAEVEAGSDKVFRSILHTRVALLNIHTQTC